MERIPRLFFEEYGSRRGCWVSQFHRHPDNVPAVEPDIRGAKTIREQMQLHLSHVECSGCHAKVDPPGYALENFDAAGKWRESYRVSQKGRSKKVLSIDASGVLMDGREFDTFQEFKTKLSEKPLPLAQNFAEKLVTYGTGSKLSFSDRHELSSLIQKAEQSDYGIRSILEQVVISSLFLKK